MEVRDGEYPLDAMLQDEQGDVKLSFRVDPTGHPADMRLLSSSGSQTLDLQSIRLANSKWTYESGQSAIVELILSWKLPLDHVGDYDIKIARSSADTQPPVPIQSHAVVVDDYPPLSIRLGETGIVGIRYVVKTDGSVGLVEIAQSSGIKRLDDAALNMVKSRWRFQPLGAATGMSATVSFHIIPPRNPLRCYASPVVAEEDVFISAMLVRGPGPNPQRPGEQLRRSVDRWVFVTGRGEISDVLIGTKSGLVRPSQTLRPAFQGNGYPKPGGAGCWYYSPIYLSN